MALESQVVAQGLSIPAGVGSDNLVVPVSLDSGLEILAVRWRRDGNAIILEPSL